MKELSWVKDSKADLAVYGWSFVFKKVKKNRGAPALDLYKYLNQSLTIVILVFNFTLFWFTELNHEAIIKSFVDMQVRLLFSLLLLEWRKKYRFSS